MVVREFLVTRGYLTRLPKEERISAVSLAFSVYICTLITIGFLYSSERFHHWFILPVLMCGILITVDAVDWLRGRREIFDPIGIVGVIGFHFFFLAPILHVHWDHWIRWVSHPPDWRPWLGGMAVLNFLGLWLYGVARRRYFSRALAVQPGVTWKVNKTRLLSALAVALLVSAVVEIVILYLYGGIHGYITVFEEERRSAFVGLGWLFAIADLFPIWLMMVYVLLARDRRPLSNWPALLLSLGTFVALQFFIGGLRGSRSNVLWAVFWAVGVVHLWVRRLPRVMLFVGLILFFMFMYFYGFYKDIGREAIATLGSPEFRLMLEQRSGRTLQAVVLGDLGRSDVQAFLLYRLWGDRDEYDYAWGRTYLGAVALLIPRAVWPDRPSTKVMEGTEALYGAGSYVPGIREASNVYGLAGETMLNFGPLAVPFAFIPLGVLVAHIKRLFLQWRRDDARWFLAPLFIALCFIVLIGDSDNILVFIVTDVALPLLILWFGSDKTPWGKS